MRSILLIAIAAAATLSPSSAFAQPDVPSVRVSYADLDLSTSAGRERFERRLATAVKRVCPSVYARDLVTQQAARSCAAKTHANLEQTVASLLKGKGVALASLTPSSAPTAR